MWGKLSLSPSSTSASHATSHASTTSLSPQDSGSLRPLSIPKPTVILPFSNNKKDGIMKVVNPLLLVYNVVDIYLHKLQFTLGSKAALFVQ